MNNEELKKKICEIIADNYLPKEMPDRLEDYKLYRFERAADALIAAGMGDVKEAEHRAARAERALKEAVDRYIGVDCLCHGADDAECKNCNEYCNIKYLEIEQAAPCAMNKFLQQAEKELAEERKDGNETD